MKKDKLYLYLGIIFFIIASLFFVRKGYFNIDIAKLFINRDNLTPEQLGEVKIVEYIRIPRMLVASFTGGLLSVSGVIFQAILFNPLADSFILGIASGASFGAALVILLGITVFGPFSIVISAFIFSLISLFIVVGISKKNGNINSNSLILSGIIVSSFFSAGLSFIQFLKGEGVEKIIYWIMGSFSSKTWTDVYILSFAFVVAVLFINLYGKQLNILSLGDRIAKSNGIDVKKIKMILLIGASFLAAVTVSISGVIGFIGLMIPHLVRNLVGSDNKKIMTLSLVYGALITMVADSLIRIYSPSEIPVGVITAFFGAPFFILIFRKKIIGRV